MRRRRMCPRLTLVQVVWRHGAGFVMLTSLSRISTVLRAHCRELSMGEAARASGGLSMADLPDGTVTFLLTDVEGSTGLWEDAPDAMHVALARHDVLFEEIVHRHRGTHIRPRGEGDSRFAVFAGA